MLFAASRYGCDAGWAFSDVVVVSKVMEFVLVFKERGGGIGDNEVITILKERGDGPMGSHQSDKSASSSE